MNSERAQCVNKSTNIKKKSLWDRAKEFKGEKLTVREGKLYCEPCSEILSSKKSIVAGHCKSLKHKKSQETFAKTKLRSQSLAEVLRKRDKTTHAVGESLPMEMRVWRLQVVQGFLAAGVPIAKIDPLRHLLESNNHRLTTRSNLSQIVPVVLQEEIRLVKDELRQPGTPAEGPYQARELSLIFDGSTRLGEAIVIIARYVDDNWKVQQRLVRLEVVATSVTGEHLAQVLHASLTDFTIHGPRLLGCTRDGASVNTAALERLRIFFPQMFDIICVSHTLDNVGAHFHTPTLDEFTQWWISLFSHSSKAKLRWRELTGQAIRSFSETRWWSRWEVQNQLCVKFGELQPFLDANQDLSPKTMDRLRTIIENEDRRRDLQLELAAVVDVGQHFVRATYILEGDGPLIFSVYKKLQEVLNACTVAHFPNVHAVAAKLVADDPELDVTNLEEQARECVQPGINWFLRKFNIQLRPTLDMFKYVRYFCPVQVQDLRPDGNAIEHLQCLPFLQGSIEGLQAELPAYLAACDGCANLSDEEKVAWWQGHSQELPCWSSAVKKVLLLQVSSAAAERVFSLLKAAFSDQQENALTDYLQASVMVRYNYRERQ